MRKKLFLLLTLISMPLTGCSAISELSSGAVHTNQWYSVSGYVDGDTFKIRTGSDDTTIRLLYVDTPETKKPNEPAESYGPEAAAFTEKLLAESGEVRLTFDKEQKDHYDRTLAVVELKDGKILNELLLEQGLAEVLIVEPNVKMENVYKQLEQQARQAKNGIWSKAENGFSSDFPVKKAARSGILIEVDKRAELVTITNTSQEPVSLNGWKLVSVRGNQTYPFAEFELKAQHKVIVSSADEPDAHGYDVLAWGASDIWNNAESDPAELYNAYNELVAVWEDE
ncbi:thermonuclease family protein [Paenibacillus arenilitoris]|uniref:Thermonuclease family protein n=1 Tax=Paenibacillus arenilitoris TaxID=2772299 RepID=A0A927H8E2_9BACL|nr:thermonuclease family protein [Paenibacillus arenilitoris]MBD2871472.1 thermonuclease family protein [Paenibacillus arenilitoris]